MDLTYRGTTDILNSKTGDNFDLVTWYKLPFTVNVTLKLKVSLLISNE